MLFDPTHENGVERLAETLRRAQAITPDLMSEVITQACVRFAAHGSAARTRVNRLIDARAWDDAILTLLELELPQWKLRRIVYDDGEWLCTLSKAPMLPLGLDETVEATHECLPLAILIALLQARHATAASATNSTSVPQVRPQQGHLVSCDNFV